MPKYVYVMKCIEDKYYVGQTDNIVRRFDEHKSGRGASWTKLYPAEAIIKLVETTGMDFVELSVTLETMNKYGVANVRGGPFAHVELSQTDIKSIFNILRQNAWPTKWIVKDCDKPLLSASPPESEDEVSAGGEKRKRTESRHGMPWLKEEDEQLGAELAQKLTVQQCADTHQRTVDSILARRLVILKKFVAANPELDTRTIADKFNISTALLATISL